MCVCVCVYRGGYYEIMDNNPIKSLDSTFIACAVRWQSSKRVCQIEIRPRYMASVTARESPARRAWSYKVCTASNITLAYCDREVDWKSIYCPESLVLPDCFGVSLAQRVSFRISGG